MLRITNGMMVNNLKRNMNYNMLRMDDLQLQLSTGKRINKPSDDPAGIVKSLRLRTNLNESEQYRANISAASSFLQNTDDALGMITDISQKLRELTVKAATTQDADAEQAIAREISELNEQLKLVANSTFGSKHIFGGTNVTEAPCQANNWLGNEEIMYLEIGVGVKIPINLKMKDYFMGRLDYLNIEKTSGIQGIEAKNLQEGQYTINTHINPAIADSTATEAQSYLGSINNNGKFFYLKDVSGSIISASLGAGSNTLANDSIYNSSLMMEVKQVKTGVPSGGPRVAPFNGDPPVLTFSEPLSTKDANGLLVAIPDGTDLAANFTYTGTGTITSAIYNVATRAVTFTIAGAGARDTIILNNDVGGEGNSKLYGATTGEEYTPVKAVFDGTDWTYDDRAKVTVDIKGHVYNSATGKHNYVEKTNVEINMETAAGEALFTIAAAEFKNPDGTHDTDFPDDLVIWNDSGQALASIDPTNPQIQVGDKTVISTAAQGAANAQNVDIGYTYLDQYGNKMSEKQHSFSFADGVLDHNSQDFEFFTLNEQTGLSYNGTINLTTDVFGNSDPNKEPSSFDYKAGLFAFVDDLARKVSLGKLPQVGNELAGHDTRLQDLLLYRSTLGARINRLELQTNRLINTEETYTTLLAYNEDANEAEVIMNLKMQENVYNAALAAGARIIQPTLVDFLR